MRKGKSYGLSGSGGQTVTRRALVTVVIDGPLFALCWYLAFFLRTGDVHLGAQWGIFVPSLPLAVGTAILGFLAAGTYRPRRTGDVLDDFRRIARGSAYGFLGFVTATVFLQISGWWPRPLFALYALLLPFAGIVSLLLRLFFRALFTLKKKAGRERPVLIIGSGEDAGHLIREMKEDGARGLTPVGIVDEGNWPQGKEIHGVPVQGRIGDLASQVKKSEPHEIIIARPDAGGIGQFLHVLRDDPDAIREVHRAYVEAGENDNLIVQKLDANPSALGIFGFSFLDQNIDRIQGSLVEGAEPTFDNIADGKYSISRSLYFYVKRAHVGRTAGLQEFIQEFTSDRASGEEGYLGDKGLIPLPTEQRLAVRQDGQDLRLLEM